MQVQEVMLKALSGEIHWFRAAEILGLSARSLRRWRERYATYGYDGLVDRRHRTPSRRRVPLAAVTQVLELYRTVYTGFNVRHFHEIVRREHGVTLSYSYVKQALQTAGLVKKHKARGRHRRRREPRACVGEMLHLDGSVHAWFALAPDERPCLVLVSDDATTRVLAAAFFPAETTHAVLTSLATVLRTEGLPMALYTDRAGWAFYTPTAKGPVDKTRLTTVGRALARLGIEHIPSYSPQARGRSERLNRTFQDRLVNELRVAGVATIAAANAYLTEQFVPQYNATFGRAPRDPASAFVPLGDHVDLDAILCEDGVRTVGRDNTVSFDGQVLQISKQPGRRTCTGLTVTVRRHLDGTFTIVRGLQTLGRYEPTGQPVTPPVSPSRSPRRQSSESGQITCQTEADKSLVNNSRP